MKNPVTILRTTTAIVISLSLAGTQAMAAGASPLEFAQAGQVLPEQAQGQAKGKDKTQKKAEKAERPTNGSAAATTAKSRTGKASRKTDGAVTDEGKAEKEPSAAKREAAGKAAGAGRTTSADKRAKAKEATAERTAAQKAAGTTEGSDAQGATTQGTTTASERPAKAKTAQQKTEGGTAEQSAGNSAASTEQPTNGAKATAQPTAKSATSGNSTTGAATAEQPASKGKANGKASETTTAEKPTASTAGKTASGTAKKPGSTAAAEQTGAGQKTAGSAEQPKGAAAGTKEEGRAKATSKAQASSRSEDTTAARTEQQAGAQAAAKETIPADQVTAQEVDQATEQGKDVVIQDKTTTDELQAQLKQLRKQQANLEQRLQQAERVDVRKETITRATAPRATEERADDDDNNVLKYLGSALAGAAVGALVPALGGRLVDRSGDRVVVERNGEFFVRSGEDDLLRQPGSRVQTEEFTSGVTRTTVTRDDGSQVVTIRNPGGFILRRTKITPAGEEIVLLEQTPDQVYAFDQWDKLQPPTAHRAEVIDYADADRDQLQQVLVPQPVYQGDQSFPLVAVLDNQAVRELVPAIDLPINFATGSAAIRQSEIDEMEELGQMIGNVIDENPRAIFLVAGHTDGVGSNVTNLVLSDKRAETVALALTEYFNIPPENLVVQGYGERFPKVPTEGPSEANRRVAVRNITPLLREQVASR